MEGRHIVKADLQMTCSVEGRHIVKADLQLTCSVEGRHIVKADLQLLIVWKAVTLSKLICNY